MLTDMIEEFAQRMKSRFAVLATEFVERFDFAGLEADLNEECAKLNAALQRTLLQASNSRSFPTNSVRI